MRMEENWGKRKILKAIMAGCLIFNNFSGLGLIINAATIEQNENNSLLNGNENEESNVVNNDTTPDDSIGGNESEEMTPTLPGDGTAEGDLGESQKPEVDQPVGGDVPSEDEQPEVPEVEVPSEDEQPEVPEVEVPSEEEADSDSDTSEDSLAVDEEEIALEEENELFSLENRSAGSGLVQLWQVVPDGQEWKEGKTTSQIMSALQCRPNHNLYSSGGQNEHNTYVNSCYVDDAFYLGEEGNYYKIYLSGYEGKVPKSESHWFELDLNGDGKKVSYEIQTVAYYIPDTSISTYAIDEEETTEILDVPELNYYDQTLDKYNNSNEKSIELYATSTVQSPSYYANESGTLIHYVTNNVTKAGSYSKVTAGKAPSWMSSGVKYYSYDGIYFYNNWRNIRVNGQGAVNQNNPFYSYYQYLPFRSKSNYSTNFFDNYTNNSGGAGGKLVNTGQYFYAVQDKYGVNGALQYAMGIHESGWGKSSLSIDKNNLFGMNATDNNPYGNGTSFPSVEAGINYHADRYLSWGYTDPIDDARYFGSHVGNKGSGMNVKYASDPFWGEKIAGWYYRFDSASGLKDYDYYTIGIKQSNVVYNIRSQASTSSKVLYQTKNKKSNLKIANYPVLITGEQNGFYQIKTDTPLNSQGNAQFNAQYQWINTYGYIDKSPIVYVNNTNYNDPLNLQSYSPTTKNSLDYIGWQNNSLILKGWALIDGINLPDSLSSTKTLILTGNNGEVKEYPLTNVEMKHVTNSDLTNPNKLYNYDYAGYEISIPLDDLPKTIGDYQFSIRMKIGLIEQTISLNKGDNLPDKYYANYTYELSSTNNQLTLGISRLDTKNVVDKLEFVNNQLEIEGWAVITGQPMTSSTDVKKTLILQTDAGKTYEYLLTNTKNTGVTNSDWVNPDKKFNYDYSGYKLSINIDQLPKENGSYKLMMKIQVGDSVAVVDVNPSITLPNNYYDKDYMISFSNANNSINMNVEKRVYDVNNTVDSISWKNNKLVIEGWALIEGIDTPTSSSVKKTLVLTTPNGVKTSYPVQNIERKGVTDSSWANPGNIFNYDYSGYKAEISIDELQKLSGTYNLSMVVEVGKTVKEIKLNPQVNVPDVYVGKYKVYEFNKLSNQLQFVVKDRVFSEKNNVDKLYWQDNQLAIEGWALIEGIDTPTSNTVKKTLILMDSNGKKYEYLMSNTQNKGVTNSEWANPGNYFNYDYSGYEIQLPEKDLPRSSGTYRMFVRIEAGSQVRETELISPSILPAIYVGQDRIYQFTSVDNKIQLDIKSKVTSFPDVEEGQWYTQHINDFVQKGFIQGYSDGTFKPNNLITRAEFVKIVNLAFGLTDKVTDLPFTDLDTEWKKEELKIALAAGYITPATTFRHNDPINRQEAAKIVGSLLNLQGDGKVDFADKDLIASWAINYVDALVDGGILTSNSEFRPQDPLTRAEAVKMLNLASQKVK